MHSVQSVVSVHPIWRLLIKVTALPFVIPSAAEGPAVRPGSHTKVSVPLALPQNRHPERSASQIDRLIQGFMARSRRACPERSRRNPGGAYLTHAVRSFSTTEPVP